MDSLSNTTHVIVDTLDHLSPFMTQMTQDNIQQVDADDCIFTQFQPTLLTIMIITKQMLVFEGSKVWCELLQSKRRHKKEEKERMILKIFSGPDILALVIKHLEGLSQRITNLQPASTI